MKSEIAYLAGVFDGDGGVHVRVRPPRKSTREKNVAFELNVRIGNTDHRLVQTFKDHFGFGNVSCEDRAPPRRDYWTWYVQHRQAERVLREIYPFLVSRKSQAKYGVLLQILKRMRWTRETPLEMLELRMKIRDIIARENEHEFKKSKHQLD